MAETIEYNAKSQSVYFMLTDSATGVRKTALTNANVTCSYTRERGNRVVITDSAIAADAAYSSGGFAEVNTTDCPGLYRLDVPDAAFAFAAGVTKVEITITGASIHSETREIELVPPLITKGTVGASLNAQPTYNEYTMADGSVRKDYV